MARVHVVESDWLFGTADASSCFRLCLRPLTCYIVLAHRRLLATWCSYVID